MTLQWRPLAGDLGVKIPELILHINSFINQTPSNGKSLKLNSSVPDYMEVLCVISCVDVNNQQNN